MKKIIFSSILIFGLAIFLPINADAQVVVKTKDNYRTTKTVKVKKKHVNRHGTQVRTNRNRVVTHRPARPRVVTHRPNYTRNNYVWLEGYWEWNTYYNNYIWRDGRWVRKRRGYHWVPGFWELTPTGGYFWIKGFWANKEQHTPPPPPPPSDPYFGIEY